MQIVHITFSLMPKLMIFNPLEFEGVTVANCDFEHKS